MGNIIWVFRLLPVLIRAAEIAHGAQQGELKRALVIEEVFAIAGIVCAAAKLPSIDTPVIRELVATAVDQIVAGLNALGVFKHRTAPS